MDFCRFCCGNSYACRKHFQIQPEKKHQPFLTHVQLQRCKADHPDRTLNSMGQLFTNIPGGKEALFSWINRPFSPRFNHAQTFTPFRHPSTDPRSLFTNSCNRAPAVPNFRRRRMCFLFRCMRPAWCPRRISLPKLLGGFLVFFSFCLSGEKPFWDLGGEFLFPSVVQ